MENIMTIGFAELSATEMSEIDGGMIYLPTRYLVKYIITQIKRGIVSILC